MMQMKNQSYSKGAGGIFKTTGKLEDEFQL